MKITIEVEVDEPEDIDEDDDTGLTEDAYMELSAALSGLAFSILDIRKAH